MAIEQIDGSDTFARFSGYYIRHTVIRSTAHAIAEVGSPLQQIATLPEEYFQIYRKNAFDHSELISEHETFLDATTALRKLVNQESH